MCGTYEKDETVTQGFLKKDYFHVVLALNDGTQSSLEMMPSAIGRNTCAHTCKRLRTSAHTDVDMHTHKPPEHFHTLPGCSSHAQEQRSKKKKKKKL